MCIIDEEVLQKTGRKLKKQFFIIDCKNEDFKQMNLICQFLDKKKYQIIFNLHSNIENSNIKKVSKQTFKKYLND